MLLSDAWIVVTLLGEVDMNKFISRVKDNKVNCKLMNDLEWMLQTPWNLGLFCFSAGRNSEGMWLFDVISEVAMRASTPSNC